MRIDKPCTLCDICKNEIIKHRHSNGIVSSYRKGKLHFESEWQCDGCGGDDNIIHEDLCENCSNKIYDALESVISDIENGI